MIQEKIHVGGLNFDKPKPTVSKKKGIKLGDICRANSEMFSGWIRCEVLKFYENSAMVKIISCRNPQDDEMQYYLGDVAIVKIRDLTVIKGVVK
ncbi:hypothetical protein WN865_00215 [Tetragenococcus halophilus]